MGGISAYLSWGLLPRLRRMALLQARRRDGSVSEEAGGLEGQALQRQEIFWLRLNLMLGMLVLALTALARVA